MNPEEIAAEYTDVWGRRRDIEPATRAALARALGRKAGAPRARIAAGRCHEPEALEGGASAWGFTVQLYGLRSARNWGIGDFGDLRALVELSAGMGAALVGVNPLHAAQVSPYSPSSRHALNVLYLEVEAIPEYARCKPARRLVESRGFQRKLKALRDSALVDYEGVRAAKL